LFDELVNAMPEGVYLSEVLQTGSRIEVSGAAQSSTRVSALMRNVDDSEYLRDVGLQGVDFATQGNERSAQFKVFAQQVSTAAPEGEPASAPRPAQRRAR
jgi:type IV pilus assembly protein PilN